MQVMRMRRFLVIRGLQEGSMERSNKLQRTSSVHVGKIKVYVHLAPTKHNHQK